jgi:S-adenosylmethionine:tRNA ribosyltransferase-isomerase
MKKLEKLRIETFDYPLPPDRIAQFPLDKRDASRLLIWKAGEIRESVFSSIHNYLPEKSLLVFNDTKVIRARLIFSKPTGATLEIFCLEPLFPTAEIQSAFHITGSCTWSCLVGNAKRWKNEVLKKEIHLNDKTYLLMAQKVAVAGDGHFQVRFSWEPEVLSFSEILELSGRIPLPPYITRSDTPDDQVRYQTIYAQHEGSVAAPTAGLHFTEEVLEQLTRQAVIFEKIALHVGVGTFRPVSVSDLSVHVMHSEKVVVSRNTLRNLISQHSRPVVAIGTTSVRTLESLYWAGVKLLSGETSEVPLIHQWDPYQPEKYPHHFPVVESLTALEEFLIRNELEEYHGSTQLMIVPGYRFRIVDAMITNFHMPQSTLLLLVAAFIGDEWKKTYHYALDHGFRFLSYGDSCLFFKKEEPFD